MRLTPLGKAYVAFLKDFMIGALTLIPVALVLAFHPWVGP